MGMASSQARLLSLTSRQHNVELKAQMLQARKLQMANESDKVYNTYLEALNASKIQYSFTDQYGETTLRDATLAALEEGILPVGASGRNPKPCSQPMFLTSADGNTLFVTKAVNDYYLLDNISSYTNVNSYLEALDSAHPGVFNLSSAKTNETVHSLGNLSTNFTSNTSTGETYGYYQNGEITETSRISSPVDFINEKYPASVKISSAEDLIKVAELMNRDDDTKLDNNISIVLANDIDFSGYDLSDRVALFDEYAGCFEGNGYKIKGLNTALFDTLCHNSVGISTVNIRNLTLVDCNVNISADKINQEGRANNFGILCNNGDDGELSCVKIDDSCSITIDPSIRIFNSTNPLNVGIVCGYSNRFDNLTNSIIGGNVNVGNYLENANIGGVVGKSDIIIYFNQCNVTSDINTTNNSGSHRNVGRLIGYLEDESYERMYLSSGVMISYDCYEANAIKYNTSMPVVGTFVYNSYWGAQTYTCSDYGTYSRYNPDLYNHNLENINQNFNNNNREHVLSGEYSVDFLTAGEIVNYKVKIPPVDAIAENICTAFKKAIDEGNTSINMLDKETVENWLLKNCYLVDDVYYDEESIDRNKPSASAATINKLVTQYISEDSGIEEIEKIYTNIDKDREISYYGDEYHNSGYDATTNTYNIFTFKPSSTLVSDTTGGGGSGKKVTIPSNMDIANNLFAAFNYMYLSDDTPGNEIEYGKNEAFDAICRYIDNLTDMSDRATINNLVMNYARYYKPEDAALLDTLYKDIFNTDGTPLATTTKNFLNADTGYKYGSGYAYEQSTDPSSSTDFVDLCSKSMKSSTITTIDTSNVDVQNAIAIYSLAKSYKDNGKNIEVNHANDNNNQYINNMIQNAAGILVTLDTSKIADMHYSYISEATGWDEDDYAEEIENVSKKAIAASSHKDISVSNSIYIEEVNDPSAIKQAEATYEADMAKINRKETRIDTELAALETERTAIKTEQDSLKNVARDNINMAFKLFS